MIYLIYKKSRLPGTTKSYNGPTWDNAGIRHRYRELYDNRQEAESLAEILSKFNPVGFAVTERMPIVDYTWNELVEFGMLPEDETELNLVSNDLISLWMSGKSADGGDLDPLSLVVCQCQRGAVCHRERTFICPDCERSYWWCYGAADDYPELCDFCWSLKHESEEDD